MITEYNFFGGGEYHSATSAIQLYSNSGMIQNVLLPSTAQDIKLPDPDYLNNGRKFLVINASTSVANLTVKNNTGSTITTLTPNTQYLFVLVNKSTDSWVFRQKTTSAKTIGVTRTSVVDQSETRGALTGDDCSVQYAEWKLINCNDTTDIIYSNSKIAKYSGKAVLLDGENFCRLVAPHRKKPPTDAVAVTVDDSGGSCGTRICATCPDEIEWASIDGSVEYVVIPYSIKFRKCANSLAGGARSTRNKSFVGVRQELTPSGSDHVNNDITLFGYIHKPAVIGYRGRDTISARNDCNQKVIAKISNQKIFFDPSGGEIYCDYHAEYNVEPYLALPKERKVVFYNGSVPAIAQGGSAVVSNEIDEPEHTFVYDGSTKRTGGYDGKMLICRRPAEACPTNAQWTANPGAEYAVKYSGITLGCGTDNPGPFDVSQNTVESSPNFQNQWHYLATYNPGYSYTTDPGDLYDLSYYEGTATCSGSPIAEDPMFHGRTDVVGFTSDSTTAGFYVRVTEDDPNWSFYYTCDAFYATIADASLPTAGNQVTLNNLQTSLGGLNGATSLIVGTGGQMIVCRRPSGI